MAEETTLTERRAHCPAWKGERCSIERRYVACSCEHPLTDAQMQRLVARAIERGWHSK
jgi:hypothetical protein